MGDTQLECLIEGAMAGGHVGRAEEAAEAHGPEPHFPDLRAIAAQAALLHCLFSLTGLWNSKRGPTHKPRSADCLIDAADGWG